jgi:hypothetical protein
MLNSIITWLPASALIALALVGCGGDNEPNERVRADIAAHQIACGPREAGTPCSAVGEGTRLAPGYWRYGLGSEACISIDLSRFEVRLTGAGKRELSGVGVIDCNYSP